MIILDLETRADKRLTETYLSNLSAPKNYKDKEKIEEWLENKRTEIDRELAIDQDYSEIACIGVKIDDESAKIVKLDDLKLDGQIVTFNGKSFDLPILIKAGIKNKIDLPYQRLKEMTKKWNSPNHIDLMELISFNGQYKSLDQYLQIYLGIKKTPCDFNTCTQEELEKHCIEDCENTYKLFKLFEPLI